MSNIEQFIADAIKGGEHIENLRLNGQLLYPNEFSSRGEISIASLLLRPSVWQAVGKVRGWKQEGSKENIRAEWQMKAMCFMGDITDGLSIDEALGSL